MDLRAEAFPWATRTLARAHDSTPTAIERLLLEAVMSAMGRPALDVRLWDGRSAWRSEREALAILRFTDRATLWRFLIRPEAGFTDGYVEGKLHIEGDLPSLLASVFRPGQTVRPTVGRSVGPSWTSRARAKSNARHHYDLGNEFYRCWLDEHMVYTCAYFEDEQVGLDQAQLAKLDLVCRKVGLRPGQRVVEIGCGWGALALHAAEHYGVYVQAFNVASEQVQWARERARARGLEHRVEFIEDDYRSARGQFDAFLAVGVLEHVGRAHYRELGEVVDRCLAPSGRGLLHFVGRAKPEPMNGWIAREIFPGAFIPSLAEMLEVLEPFAMAVVDVENLRRHYERTLDHWLTRFDAAVPDITAMLDDRRVRSYRLYLASALAAFRVGTCQLYQVAFARANNSVIPWTRKHLYDAVDAVDQVDPVTHVNHEEGPKWTVVMS